MSDYRKQLDALKKDVKHAPLGVQIADLVALADELIVELESARFYLEVERGARRELGAELRVELERNRLNA